jgi:hypothetical protein
LAIGHGFALGKSIEQIGLIIAAQMLVADFNIAKGSYSPVSLWRAMPGASYQGRAL